ncbi:MAG: cysteine desulfurase [Planctomycetes bacterium]|nr:cysteine desulfurase [Planctomycetota bacterium]
MKVRSPAATESAARKDAAPARFDVAAVRKDFPILAQRVYGKPLIYLDNAATSQKPQAVIDAIANYYSESNANVHRAVHALGARATEAYEEAREKVRRFLNAGDAREIIFVRSATEGINLVARSFGAQGLARGGEILITAMEHHSNIVPWQLLCEERGARLRVVPMNDDGELLLDEYEKLLTPRTRLVAASHLSNALGTLNPVARMIELAHARGVPVLLDGAQAAPHLPIDVRGLDCDFYVFSGHKLYGPTGIGVLYGKAALLEAMPPYQGGGDMIRVVTFEKTTFNDLPWKFEAGTPHISGAIGLGAAVDYLERIGRTAIEDYESGLFRYAEEALARVPDLVLFGSKTQRRGVLSFNLGRIHPHDVGTVLDRAGIAIRAGHHCAQPVMDRLGVTATARASIALFNTREEIDRLAEALVEARRVFG